MCLSFAGSFLLRFRTAGGAASFFPAESGKKRVILFVRVLFSCVKLLPASPAVAAQIFNLLAPWSIDQIPSGGSIAYLLHGASIAELHSAGRRQVRARLISPSPADCKSAIQQNAILRYSGCGVPRRVHSRFQIFCLEKFFFSVKRKGSLKRRKRFPPNRSQMSGNPVRIRDGCATVTATIPNATERNFGKAGKGLKPKSGYRLDCARQLRTFRGTSPQREG